MNSLIIIFNIIDKIKKMKIRTIFIVLILNSIMIINNICIEGDNCPAGKGICRGNNCICLNNYWSIINKANPSSTIYCNYKRINHFFILIIEFFLPSFGHLIAGKYYFFIIKFLLLFCFIICSLIGFFAFKRGETIENNNAQLWRPSREDVEENDNFDNSLDEQLHQANRANKNINKRTYLLSFLSFISLILFLFMHLVDIFCYMFALYYDGNGVPFA